MANDKDKKKKKRSKSEGRKSEKRDIIPSNQRDEVSVQNFGGEETVALLGNPAHNPVVLLANAERLAKQCAKLVPFVRVRSKNFEWVILFIVRFSLNFEIFRYEILKEISSDHFGFIYKVRETNGGEYRLKTEPLTDDPACQEFKSLKVSSFSSVDLTFD